MRINTTSFVTGIALAVASTAWAHHSQSEFNFKMKVEVSGTVTKVEWRSPHARVYLDVIGKGITQTDDPDVTPHQSGE